MTTYGGILGEDRNIPKDRKLIVTDLAIDTWVSSHYGIKLDKIPSGRAGKIPMHLFREMKKTYARKLASFDKDPAKFSSERDEEESDSSEYCGKKKDDYDYRLCPPKTYRHVTYVLNSDEKSIIDTVT